MRKVTANSHAVRTRLFIDGRSSLTPLTTGERDYKKAVDINCNEAALLFFTWTKTLGWVPYCASDYYPIEDAPNFIKKHLPEDFSIVGLTTNRWFYKGELVDTKNIEPYEQ